MLRRAGQACDRSECEGRGSGGNGIRFEPAIKSMPIHPIKNTESGTGLESVRNWLCCHQARIEKQVQAEVNSLDDSAGLGCKYTAPCLIQS